MKISLLIVLTSFYYTNISAQFDHSHNLFNQLLNKHVSIDGSVNYKGFLTDSSQLNAYTKSLSSNEPNESWTENQKKAYWINAYNAFTITLIIRNYPLNSITDLHPTIKIPGISTVWHKKFFNINGKPQNLNNIEHEILRKQFNDPRIHFAIVCASFSCPQLLNDAFIASKLDHQLTTQGIQFINDLRKNKINSDKVEISKIFQWFKSDFTIDETLIQFLNKFSTIPINENAKISYLSYNWNLNE